MAYLYYSTWILTEHLRLWDALIRHCCLGWCRFDRDTASSPPEVAATGTIAPPPERGAARDRTPPAYFERLVASAERIARHAAYPGKQQAVGHCVEDVEDLIASGRITAEQGEILLNILSGACLQVA